MAGHSKFKNIMHRKGAQDKKRAKMFTKVMREIIVSARIGGADPQFNPRLRGAIIDAKNINMPRDKIENAINKAQSNEVGDNYEEVRYEGYGPHGTAIIVEGLTDNRNRTASEVRSAFTKFGGSLGELGSVSYLFQHVGMIIYNSNVTDVDSMLEYALEAGADDCAFTDDEYEIICTIEKFNKVKELLESKFGEAKSANITWKPNVKVNLDNESAIKVLKFIEALEDSDDVQTVIGNFVIPDEVLDKDD